MMTGRERRDYFFFVMKSWRMEMERSQQFVKAMEKTAAGGAAAGAPLSAAGAEPEPEVATDGSGA